MARENNNLPDPVETKTAKPRPRMGARHCKKGSPETDQGTSGKDTKELYIQAHRYQGFKVAQNGNYSSPPIFTEGAE